MPGPRPLQWSLSSPHRLADYLHSLPDDHPVHVVLRTYALSLSLSLGPALIPFVISPSRVGGSKSLRGILKRELSLSGFAFAMTVGVGGGVALKHFWDIWEDANSRTQPLHKMEPSSPLKQRFARLRRWLASLKDSHKTFLFNVISASLAITLMHSHSGSHRKLPHRVAIPLTVPMSSALRTNATGGRPSPTLDLTLLFLVRALDSIFRSTILPSVAGDVSDVQSRASKEKIQRRRRTLSTNIDAFVFWASSARIIWCFFYEPERLPRSYNKWIMSMANIDPRILEVLRAIRTGAVSYTRHICNPPGLVSSLSQHLGYPASWGDLSVLPAVGGPSADVVWEVLGVRGRKGVGGIPCEVVHGGDCTANVGRRGVQAFTRALAIYLPVHILPILVRNPQKLLQTSYLTTTVFSIIRSATFLSTFVSSIWFAICFTRTLFLARLFPWIPHDFWDGPFGCTLAGSLVCGTSIWIEQGRRRGEMALYVLPRAIRACLPGRWIRSGRMSVRVLERLTFVLSLATLLTASSHQAGSLRGLSRWTLMFVTKGPNTAFWKRRQQDTSNNCPTAVEAPISTNTPNITLDKVEPTN